MVPWPGGKAVGLVEGPWRPPHLGSHDWLSAGPQNPVAPETNPEAPSLGPSLAPGSSHHTLALIFLLDGGSGGGSVDPDPGVRGTGAQVNK